MFKKILFASEFGPVSSNAERYAIDLARTSRASCHLIHVIEAIHLDDDQEVENLYTNLKARASFQFDKILERFREAEVSCDGHIEIGQRWRSILAAADEYDCDLIVLGTRRFDDHSRPYLGTTSHKIFMTSPVPLLVIPSVTTVAAPSRADTP